jgi:hypothetical protein
MRQPKAGGRSWTGGARLGSPEGDDGGRGLSRAVCREMGCRGARAANDDFGPIAGTPAIGPKSHVVPIVGLARPMCTHVGRAKPTIE